MRIPHALRLLGMCLALGTTAATVARADSGCAVAGRYTVVGRVPGAVGSYQGEAVVSVGKGEGCIMKWFPPNASEGSGDYTNGTLTIHFTFAGNGRSGVVRYQRAPNGDLHGVWWTNDKPDAWGTETLLAAR